jgi:PAS domain S-box-containing protein
MTSSIRVLHVDDEPGFAEMAGEFLEREDDRFEVETATSAADGREYVDSVDCIVSDFDMPETNGLEFLETVREDHPDLPFILFTGKGSEEVASEAFSAGATDYLQKEGGTDQYTILANRVLNYVETAETEFQRQRQLDAIETAQEGISLLDQDERFIYVNQAYADLYGYEPEELVGEHWEILYPEGSVEDVRENIISEVQGNGGWSGKTTGLRADGSTFVEDHTLAMTEHGELVCTVRDVTERKERGQALAALHEAATDLEAADTEERVYEILVDAAEDILDFDLVAVDVVDDDALVQAAWSLDLDTEGYYERTSLEEDDTFATRAYNEQRTILVDNLHDYEITPADSEYRSVLTVPIAEYGTFQTVSREEGVFDESDQELVELLVGHVREALARLEGERQLRERTDELERQNERLDEFAALVSHDLRTPMNVARGNLELAQERCDAPELDKVAEAIDRMETLTEDILTLAREGQMVRDREQVDVNDVVTQCWSAIGSDGSSLEVADDFTIQGDPSRIQQVFEKVLRNALDHGRQNGTENAVTVTVGETEDGFYVADDGPGIPEDERDTVFDRGYTTSDDGTGLGLAIVEEIVEAHGWDVDVTESEAGGARFEVTGVSS